MKVAHGSAGSDSCPMNLELRDAETPQRPSDEVIVVPGKARRLKKPERSSSYVRISEGGDRGGLVGSPSSRLAPLTHRCLDDQPAPRRRRARSQGPRAP